MAEETLRDCPAIDYICVGEGEVTLTDFLRAVEKKEDLKGLRAFTTSMKEGNSSIRVIVPSSKPR